MAMAENNGIHKDIKLKFGEGLISGVIAFLLSLLSFLGVLAFYFPEYLTTPDLRKIYDVDFIRQLMFYALVLAGGLATFNIVRGNKKRLGLASWLLILITVMLGANSVEVKDFAADTPYIGMDWFILDLLASSLIFIVIEKIWPFRDQSVLRLGWQTDLNHFLLNHLMVGFVLLVANHFVSNVFGWAVGRGTEEMIAALPFVAQVFLIILFADLVQYASHRAYHEIPFLWRFHAVHHSAKRMDWLAGSRQHILELMLTRSLVLVPVFVLGFPKEVVDTYIIVVGFQAVFNHANVNFNFGWLKYFIVTPQFHHWHHASDDAAIDRNYAAHFSFIDYLFGTAVKGEKDWPVEYGVVGNYVPDGVFKQILFPFKKTKKVD
jgi:sterol desaturase/sphingolipid hydroxylase (fatty acid hydroxylase superfamily)